MKGTRDITLWGLLVLYTLGIIGCGKKTDVRTDVKVDENKPISEVQAEAEKMNTEELRAAVMAYKEAIMAKSDEVEKIANKLIEVTLAGGSKDESKKLNTQMGEINKTKAALTERLQIYYEKLKEKGGDLTGSER